MSEELKSLQTVYGENVLMMRVDDCLIFGNKNALRSLAEKLTEPPSVEPEQMKDRKFLEIIVNYPKICTYPEYEDKPYYSIKYEENGDMIVGYSTYKPEVLSQYLREYFISPTEPERKTGRWVLWNGPWSEYIKCTACGKMYNQDDLYIGGNDYPKFCPNCGAKMTRGE